jgi:hypothetical protein
MRQLLATISNAKAPSALLGALLLNLAATPAGLSDPTKPAAPELETPPPVATCGVEDLAVYRIDRSSLIAEAPCAAHPRAETEVTAARAYLVGTAHPGDTMTRQGPELAIERLHPEFVVRLSNAIREARNGALPFAGIFSAYRPPAFGVGGFSDKFNSLHTYGLAVDMDGIGRPGSQEAQLWHAIAAKHGIICPYGFNNRAEWNHCQPTGLMMVTPNSPLRETVTADGPRSLEDMFEAGYVVIASGADVTGSIKASARAAQVMMAHDNGERLPTRAALTSGKTRVAAKAVRAAARKSPAHSNNGHVRDASARSRVIAEEEGQRKRKSARGSASIEVKRRST